MTAVRTAVHVITIVPEALRVTLFGAAAVAEIRAEMDDMDRAPTPESEQAPAPGGDAG